MKPFRAGAILCVIWKDVSLKDKAAAKGDTGQAGAGAVICIDFSPYGVDLHSFPQNAWRKLSKEVLLEEERSLFQLGDPQGELQLRCSIAAYLHQARAVEADPEQIVVGAGNDFLLLLLCSLFGTGQTIAMESPTYKKAYDLFRRSFESGADRRDG